MTQEQFNELFPASPQRTDNHTINIEPLQHGYIVNYGCQRLAIENVDKLIELRENYIVTKILLLRKTD